MILSNKLFNAQGYLRKMTNHVYFFSGKQDMEDMHKYLKERGLETEEEPLWDYSLLDTDEVLANDIPVVLLEIGWWDENDVPRTECRWMEVPERLIPVFKLNI